MSHKAHLGYSFIPNSTPVIFQIKPEFTERQKFYSCRVPSGSELYIQIKEKVVSPACASESQVMFIYFKELYL